jgi:hypothetical protein
MNFPPSRNLMVQLPSFAQRLLMTAPELFSLSAKPSTAKPYSTGANETTSY